MRICVLASGSKGNCTFIESDNTKILIDAGLSKRELESRLSLIGVNPAEIDSILVTHEHSDHINGVGNFARKYGTKVYAHKNTWDILSRKIGPLDSCQEIEFDGRVFYLENLAVETFDVDHDASHCVGFSIIENSKQFTIATDLGHTTEDILTRFSSSDLVILESNHDVQTLQSNPNYPYQLKQRIMSMHGHLSNEVAADAILSMLNGKTRGVILGHLSEQNNTPDLALNAIKKALQKNGAAPNEQFRVDVATQNRVSNIYKIKN